MQNLKTIQFIVAQCLCISIGQGYPAETDQQDLKRKFDYLKLISSFAPSVGFGKRYDPQLTNTLKLDTDSISGYGPSGDYTGEGGREYVHYTQTLKDALYSRLLEDKNIIENYPTNENAIHSSEGVDYQLGDGMSMDAITIAGEGHPSIDEKGYLQDSYNIGPYIWKRQVDNLDM